MFEIRKISGAEALQQGWADSVIELDRLNMSGILAEAGREFPEDVRRAGFLRNPVLIMAIGQELLAGYLQYTRDWNNERNIYLSSVQISPKFRGGKLLGLLLVTAAESLLQEDFDSIILGVQKNNTPAVRMYERLGFVLCDNPERPNSLTGTASKDILKGSLISKFRKSRK